MELVVRLKLAEVRKMCFVLAEHLTENTKFIPAEKNATFFTFFIQDMPYGFPRSETIKLIDFFGMRIGYCEEIDTLVICEQ